MTQRRSQSEIADLLCNAYVRHESFVPVPLDIISMIITFYLDVFVFNKEHHGSNIAFVNKTTVTKSLPLIGRKSWCECAFGEKIMADMCAIFEIKFKWITMSKHDFPCIGFGFLSSMLLHSWNLNICNSDPGITSFA